MLCTVSSVDRQSKTFGPEKPAPPYRTVLAWYRTVVDFYRTVLAWYRTLVEFYRPAPAWYRTVVTWYRAVVAGYRTVGGMAR